jgi:hypothetical protein
MRAQGDLDPLEPVEPLRVPTRSRRRLRWAVAAAVLLALAAIPLAYSRLELDAFRGTRGEFEAWAAGAQAAPPGSAAAIDRAALATRDPRNLYRRDGRVVLYGQRTNGADTNRGSWACAKVVSLVLARRASISGSSSPSRASSARWAHGRR